MKWTPLGLNHIFKLESVGEIQQFVFSQAYQVVNLGEPGLLIMIQATQLHCNGRVRDFRTLYPISNSLACHFPGDRSSGCMKTTDGDFSTCTGAEKSSGATSWSYSSSHCSPMPNRMTQRGKSSLQGFRRSTSWQGKGSTQLTLCG